MSAQTDLEPDYSNASASESEAIAYALSVHYITMALYTIGVVVSAGMLLLAIAQDGKENIIAYTVLTLLPVILFLMHLLAVKGLKKRQSWGYKASKGLGILLLLGFPFGTVLGVLLLQQLSKFKFSR